MEKLNDSNKGNRKRDENGKKNRQRIANKKRV